MTKTEYAFFIFLLLIALALIIAAISGRHEAPPGGAEKPEHDTAARIYGFVRSRRSLLGSACALLTAAALVLFSRAGSGKAGELIYASAAATGLFLLLLTFALPDRSRRPYRAGLTRSVYDEHTLGSSAIRVLTAGILLLSAVVYHSETSRNEKPEPAHPPAGQRVETA